MRSYMNRGSSRKPRQKRRKPKSVGGMKRIAQMPELGMRISHPLSTTTYLRSRLSRRRQPRRCKRPWRTRVTRRLRHLHLMHSTLTKKTSRLWRLIMSSQTKTCHLPSMMCTRLNCPCRMPRLLPKQMTTHWHLRVVVTKMTSVRIPPASVAWKLRKNLMILTIKLGLIHIIWIARSRNLHMLMAPPSAQLLQRLVQKGANTCDANWKLQRREL